MRNYRLLNPMEACQRLAVLLQNEHGQDLIEYALIAGFVAVAVGAVFPTTLSPNISRIFSKLGSIMNQA